MTTSTVKFSNFATTTLVGTYGTGDTALTVSSAAAFPIVSGGTSWFYAVIADSLSAPTKREIVKVTNVAGSIFTVTRAQDGTTAQTWATGSYIELRAVNKALQDLYDEAVSTATSGVSSLTSTTDITITADSDNNGTGSVIVKSGPDTVLEVKNNGELVANPGYANIKHFGGDPTGASDTVAAFNAAIAAGYTSIYFPKGTYKFLSGVSVTNQNLTIFGDGNQNTTLFTSGAFGFDLINFTGRYQKLTTDVLIVRDICLETRCASGSPQGSAIYGIINYPVAVNWPQPISSVLIDNVSITIGVDSAAWEKGIELDTCHMAKISNVFVMGFMPIGAGGARSTICLDIYSRFPTNNNGKATDINILNCVLHQGAVGVQINHTGVPDTMYVEGVHVNGCTILNCTKGILLGDSSVGGYPALDGLPGWFFAGNHITATDVAIDIQTVSQFLIDSNLIYATGGTTFSGIKVTTAATSGLQMDGLISNNTIINPASYSSNTYGVNFISADASPGTASIRVSNNSFEGFTTAVIGDSTILGVTVTPDNRVLSGGIYSLPFAGNVAGGFSGNVGVNASPPSAQGAAYPMLFVGANGVIGGYNEFNSVTNGYRDSGGTWRYIAAGSAATAWNHSAVTGGVIFYSSAVAANAGDPITFLRRFEIKSDGRVLGTALHNNSGAVTGTTDQYVASGTYTPTLTNTTNIASSGALTSQWIRVGNVVTVSGAMNVDTTAAGASVIEISLPIASNFTAPENCSGVSALSATTAIEAGAITGSVANDRAILSFNSVTTTVSNWTFHFTYVVL